MMFQPIAIIGRACLFPGALNPQQLWNNSLEAKNCLTPLTTTHIGIDPKPLLSKNNPDYFSTDISGYVQGFADVFNPEGFFVSPQQIQVQDLSSRWLCHVGREALCDAGYPLSATMQQRVGAIMGLLSYPTFDLSCYAETTWLANQALSQAEVAQFQLSTSLTHPQHRFMSGFPVHFMAQALGLHATSYALDAACASALYAIKLACDQLHDGKADMMLAGGINTTDSLFLHLGFTALQALSATGQSRPLHQEANGLIPAQGVGMVVLKRLTDAVADNDPILGVIRAVGLSNDGNTNGFLVPASSGQVQAMKQAYELSGIKPEEVSWVECHATGTSVGDATEIRSMQQVFTAATSIGLGTLKANIGHSITAAGAAGLLNILSAFKAEQTPPNLYAPELPNAALANTPFKISAQSQPWHSKTPRIAAVNAFGFGGNNAHLLVEEWQPASKEKMPKTKAHTATEEIAIVGIGVVAASSMDRRQFTEAWYSGQSQIREYQTGLRGGYIDTVDLAIKKTRFPPTDLQHALGQQLTILKATQEALAEVKPINPATTSILVGMQCDAEVSRYGLRVRLANLLTDKSAAWLQQARDEIHAPLESADAIGAMPNIVANRLNVQFDCKAPSFTLSAEENSGLVALYLAVRELRAHAIDSAIVGAVDLCCELVQRSAAVNVLAANLQIPGDAAVILILKRLSDAKTQGDKIYAVLTNEDDKQQALELNPLTSSITQQFGHAHAASGLLHVAAAAIACDQKQLPGEAWEGVSGIKVVVDALGEQRAEVFLSGV